MTRGGRTRLARIGGILALLAAVPAGPSPARSEVAPATVADYRLGPGDKVRITVYDEDSLTGEYLVSERGEISFPLLGDVHAGGRTVPELRAALQQRLAKGLLNAPRVTAEVLGFRPFYILGEVNKPGMYPYTIGLKLYSAVAIAQGFTYRASTRTVLITHAGESQERRVAVTTATEVLPGDVIRIREKLF